MTLPSLPLQGQGRETNLGTYQEGFIDESPLRATKSWARAGLGVISSSLERDSTLEYSQGEMLGGDGSIRPSSNIGLVRTAQDRVQFTLL